MSALVDFLLGTVRLNTNADTDKYESTAYSIGFDLQSQFYLNDEWDKDIIIFDIDNNLVMHTDISKRDNKFLVKDQQMSYMILQQQQKIHILLTASQEKEFLWVCSTLAPIVFLEDINIRICSKRLWNETIPLQKKLTFSLRISLVNVTKSLRHIFWRNS